MDKREKKEKEQRKREISAEKDQSKTSAKVEQRRTEEKGDQKGDLIVENDLGRAHKMNSGGVASLLLWQKGWAKMFRLTKKKTTRRGEKSKNGGGGGGKGVFTKRRDGKKGGSFDGKGGGENAKETLSERESGRAIKSESQKGKRPRTHKGAFAKKFGEKGFGLLPEEQEKEKMGKEFRKGDPLGLL